MQKNSETLSLFDQTTYQESTSSLSDSLAKICHSLENEEDYKLTEAAYSLKQLKSLGLKDPNILSLKMSKGCSVVTEEKTSTSYCERLPTLGTMVNGNLLILGGFSPKTERGYILSDILEESVDQKYFLSAKMVERIKKAEEWKI